jgi:hypothetical protein
MFFLTLVHDVLVTPDNSDEMALDTVDLCDDREWNHRKHSCGSPNLKHSK